MQRIPTLVGTSGHFIGESFPLKYGIPVTVGRSRKADISLKRTAKYRAQSAAERELDEMAQTVSSQHFQITLHNLRSIELKNLSPNGTRLDGQPVETAVIQDILSKAHEIHFGLVEAMKLEMRGYETASAELVQP